MTNQFPQPIFSDADFVEGGKPSFLSRFICTILGLGILTVIGVASYSASTRYVEQLNTVQPVKTVVVQPIPQPDSGSEDGLEPMVAPRTTSSDGETALPPVQSPFATPQPTPNPAVATRTTPATTRPAPAPEATLPTNDSQIHSADEVTLSDADQQRSVSAMPAQPDKIENPKHDNADSTSTQPVVESPVPVPEP